MPTYGSRWPTYAKQWNEMQRDRLSMAHDAAERILVNKSRYQAVEAKTGVPWYWIGATHYREADLDFSTQLAQGDPLNRVSTHVPRGQGPYFGDDAWERAALIALEDHGLTKVIDWRLEKLLYWWESYNGWGYSNHGVPSAYVWAGTTIYDGGMYVADGVWSATAKDRRVGCAAILKWLTEIDSSILLIRETADMVPSLPRAPTIPAPETKPMADVAPTVPAQTPADVMADLIAARLQARMAQPETKASMTAIFSTLFSGAIGSSPYLAIIGLVLQVVLTNADVMGTPIQTATGSNTATGLLGILGAGILNRILPKAKP